MQIGPCCKPQRVSSERYTFAPHWQRHSRMPAWRSAGGCVTALRVIDKKNKMAIFDQSCIDKSLPIPVGRQLHGLLSYVIAFGLIPAGERLPSVRELALAVGVAPMTVNDVYQELRGTGLIEIRPGVGAFASGAGKRDAELMALRADIALLIEKGADIGLTPIDLAAMVTTQARLQPSQELRIGLIGIFRAAALDYAAEITAMIEGPGAVEVYLIDDLQKDEAARAACSACDVVLVPIHREHEIRALLPRASVAGLRMIPSQATRSALANLDPRARVAGISHFEEHVASLKHAIREFTPHVADVRTSWIDAVDLAEVLRDRDVVIYATGAEHIIELLSEDAEHFEFRHTPDPIATGQFLAALRARDVLRRDRPDTQEEPNGIQDRSDLASGIHDARQRRRREPRDPRARRRG
ncbi:GntR family transcriptional regulator [Sphingomonas nostoxanthinifaciens]|uniref:GntR family transcriptional regulator n=1 Tax=Sphingomonas nostoxanthinifaciens TaxID=2872652 RepID=UPI001CC1E69D|nr:GntR family transcriptional regulator [Sphingomonas nostoxanthinifaciens]UAK25813.1 GntR family transcriptional regulator [Sphingomonas nostoxanthinifaciens]